MRIWPSFTDHLILFEKPTPALHPIPHESRQRMRSKPMSPRQFPNQSAVHSLIVMNRANNIIWH
ncbi:hypothetical protein BDW69DRAFT_163779 [Aspergillus filifer]